MASLYRPVFNRYIVTVDSDNGPKAKRVSAKEAKDAQGNLLPGLKHARERSKKWYGKYRDHNGDLKKTPLSPVKELARSMLVELVRKAQRRRAGQEDPFEQHRNKDLVCAKCHSTGKSYDRHTRKHLECAVCGPAVKDNDKAGIPHLSAYRRYLQGKGDGAEHVATTIRRIRAILEGCKFRRLDQTTGNRVSDFLRDLRARGTSVQTSNYYLVAIKAFCQWTVKDRRTGENPLAYLSKVRETAVTLERRNLPPEEFARFLEAARESGDVFRGVNGPDRAMLYAVAAYTGLRAAELASLGPSSLALKGDPPTIELEAAYSKRRRRDVQPLPQWLADRLTEWLAGKAARKPVKLRIHADASKAADVRLWPKTGWYRKAAKMLRADLQRAREAWISEAQAEGERQARESSSVLAYQDKSGRVFDFHALRHQFISALAAAGVHPKTAQLLARHSTINLTMNRYSHMPTADVAGALDRLPEPRTIGEGSQAARATGTDGAKGIASPRHESLASPVAIPPADISGISRVISPPVGTIGKTADSPSQETRKPLKNKGLRRGQSLASSVDRAGVEPATPGIKGQGPRPADSARAQ